MSYKLDDEEKEILEAFEAGKLEAAPDADAQIIEAQAIAWHTLNTTDCAEMLAALNEAYEDFPDDEERAVQQEMFEHCRQLFKNEFMDCNEEVSNA